MEYRSPGFSDFRELMDQWDEAQEKEKIQALLDTNNLIFFFKKDGDVYGAPEGSRVTYAKMKNPDEDADDAWIKEATFMAVNLSKAMNGEISRSVLDHNDLKSMKIMDQDAAETALAKIGSSDKIKVDLGQDGEDAPTAPTAPDASPTIDKISEK